MTVRVEHIAPDTLLLDCGTDPAFSLPRVAYLLLGDLPALIDPGWTVAAADLLTGASTIGFDFAKLVYIIPTHIHLDHAGGTGFLMQHLPDATVVLHPRGIRHMLEPAVLVRNARTVFGEKFEEETGPVLPIPRERVHEARDGEVISLGKRQLRLHFAPGHAAHHIVIEDSLTGGLFCGDALGFIAANVPDTAFPVGLSPFDPESYLKTIDKLAGLGPRTLFYAHHRARTDSAALLGRLREICVCLSEMVSTAVRLGEPDTEIFAKVQDYVKDFTGGADLPVVVEAGISGYIEYYRGRKRTDA
jgi:glyoxylase-like metal-dependent hydrolase (beta-lactamase superfamily II)